MIAPPGTLLDWCNRYARARALAKDTRRHMVRSCELLTAWLGQSPKIRDVSEDVLSAWLESIEELWSARTRLNHRANILTVLRFAADCGSRPEPNVRRVRRIKVPPPDPRAWTDDQLAAFFRAAASLQGMCRTRPKLARADYLLALAGTAYDTGLRRSDLMRIERDQIGGDGTIRLRQHKTKDPHLCAITPHVRELLLSIPYEQPLKWTDQNTEYVALWNEARKAAGIASGGCHQIRRTAATIVWEENPELVQRFLGHRTPTMWRHYVDQRRSAKPILPAKNFLTNPIDNR